MDSVRSVVFKESENLEGSSIIIEGYDFNNGVNYPQLFKSMLSTGFQASNLGDAIQIVNQMVSISFLSFFKLCYKSLLLYAKYHISVCGFYSFFRFSVNLDSILVNSFTE